MVSFSVSAQRNCIFQLVADKLSAFDNELIEEGAGLLLAMIEHPFVTKPLGELLYKGYDDPILDLIYNLTHNPLTEPLMKILLKDMTLPDRMGFFYGVCDQMEYAHVWFRLLYDSTTSWFVCFCFK